MAVATSTRTRAAGQRTGATRTYTGPFADLVNRSAVAVGVDPFWLAALLSVETGRFDPDVITGRKDSPAGAVGIAQIHAPSHPDVSRAEATNPAFAVPWAARYLDALRDRAGGSLTAALRAYNTGRPSRSAAGDEYVRLVTERRRELVRDHSSIGARIAAAVRSLFYPLGAAAKIGGGPAEHATRKIGNWWSDHAVDLMVAGGTPVVAIEDLTVGAVTRRPSTGTGVNDGSTIFADGKSGERYAFLHLDPRTLPRLGQRVAAGSTLGYVAAGTAGGPHLHFATRDHDPLALVQRLAAAGPGKPVDASVIGWAGDVVAGAAGAVGDVTGAVTGAVGGVTGAVGDAAGAIGGIPGAIAGLPGSIGDAISGAGRTLAYAGLWLGFMVIGFAMIYAGTNRLLGRSAGADAQKLLTLATMRAAGGASAGAAA